MRDHVVAVAESLNTQLASLVGQMRESLASQIVELNNDPSLVALLGSSIEGNVDTILHALQHDISGDGFEPPAAAVEYARRLAQWGVPVNALVRAYRLGQQFLLARAFDASLSIPASETVRVRANAASSTRSSSTSTGSHNASCRCTRPNANPGSPTGRGTSRRRARHPGRHGQRRRPAASHRLPRPRTPPRPGRLVRRPRRPQGAAPTVHGVHPRAGSRARQHRGPAGGGARRRHRMGVDPAVQRPGAAIVSTLDRLSDAAPASDAPRFAVGTIATASRDSSARTVRRCAPTTSRCWAPATERWNATTNPDCPSSTSARTTLPHCGLGADGTGRRPRRRHTQRHAATGTPADLSRMRPQPQRGRDRDDDAQELIRYRVDNAEKMLPAPLATDRLAVEVASLPVIGLDPPSSADHRIGSRSQKSGTDLIPSGHGTERVTTVTFCGAGHMPLRGATADPCASRHGLAPQKADPWDSRTGPFPRSMSRHSSTDRSSNASATLALHWVTTASVHRR